MGEYEIINNLCNITDELLGISNELLKIVHKQAEVIAQADIPEDLFSSLKEEREKVSDRLDVTEYRLRKFI